MFQTFCTQIKNLVTTKQKSTGKTCNNNKKRQEKKLKKTTTLKQQTHTREKKLFSLENTQSNQKTKDKMTHGCHPKRKWTELTNQRHRVAEWITKQNPNISCLQEIHLSYKAKYRLKVKMWKMILQVNGIQRKAGVAIFKTDFKTEKGSKRQR